jgi:isopentenyl-diphosphate delta-isomerase
MAGDGTAFEAGASAGPGTAGDLGEWVVLVDGQDRACGVAPKLAAHRDGLRHRAFSVFVRDEEGRVLLQRRAPGKYHSAGLWSNACCGHPRPGEGTAAAALRRLGEELGFGCGLDRLGRVSYAARLDGGMAENEVVSLFAGRHDGPIDPAPEEVDAVAWMAVPDLLADLDRRPGAYTYWFRLYLREHAGMLRLKAGQGGSRRDLKDPP